MSEGRLPAENSTEGIAPGEYRPDLLVDSSLIEEPEPTGHLVNAPYIVILMGLVAAVYWKIIGYPHIQDDWKTMYFISRMSFHELLEAMISTPGLFYRPLSSLYHWLSYRIFGMNPAGFHLAAVLLLVAGAIVAARLIYRITGDRIVSGGVGVLYATAVIVHMEPMLWEAGINELGGSLFVLISFLLFLNDRVLLSLLAWLVALLFKESAAFLPAVFFVYILWRERRGFSLKALTGRIIFSLWPYALLMGLYLVFKAQGTSPTGLPDNHPYVIHFLGDHIIGNALLYTKWGLMTAMPYLAELPVKESFFRWLSLKPFLASLIIVLPWMVVAGLMFLSSRQVKEEVWQGPGGKERAAALEETLFLAAWFWLPLVPAVFMPNHIYKYYMIHSLAPLLAAFLLALRALAGLFFRKRAIVATVIAALLAVNVLFSGLYFHHREAEGLGQRFLKGTNRLIKRGRTVRFVRRDIEHLRPTLPAGSILVFEGLDVWAFDKYGPRMWYNDTTLEVFDRKFVKSDSRGIFVEGHKEEGADFYTGDRGKRKYLPSGRVFFFRAEGERLFDETKGTKKELGLL